VGFLEGAVSEDMENNTSHWASIIQTCKTFSQSGQNIFVKTMQFAVKVFIFPFL